MTTPTPKEIWKKFIHFKSKYHYAVQTDSRLGELDYNDDKWMALEKKLRQAWKDCEQAESDLKAALLQLFQA